MVLGEKNMMIQGAYSGFLKYKKENGVWHVSRISNFDKPVSHLVFGDKFTAWMAHPNKGLERVQFDKDFRKVISFQSYANKGIWST